jgi:hypothetical protein
VSYRILPWLLATVEPELVVIDGAPQLNLRLGVGTNFDRIRRLSDGP